MAAETIAVHHAGSGETLGGYPRVKIWCDLVPNLALKALFKDVARDVMGIWDIHDSQSEDAHIELIIEPGVILEKAVSSWIDKTNARLSEAPIEQFQRPDPDVLARHSATSTFHGADRSD